LLQSCGKSRLSLFRFFPDHESFFSDERIMNSGEYWRMLFENWPASLPRRGLLVTSFGEPIPFVGYLLSPGILLLERDVPDSSGGRKVMVSFDAINALKITDVIELNRFHELGFQPPA
jgi:hypothetical protein